LTIEHWTEPKNPADSAFGHFTHSTRPCHSAMQQTSRATPHATSWRCRQSDHGACSARPAVDRNLHAETLPQSRLFW